MFLSHQITAQTVCLNSKPAFNISSTCSSNKQVVRGLNRCGKLRNLKTSTYGKYSPRQPSLSVAGNKRGGAPIKLRTGLQLNSRMFSWQVRIAVSGYFTLAESEQYHDRTVPLLAPLCTLCSTNIDSPHQSLIGQPRPPARTLYKGGARRHHASMRDTGMRVRADAFRRWAGIPRQTQTRKT